MNENKCMNIKFAVSFYPCCRIKDQYTSPNPINISSHFSEDGRGTLFCPSAQPTDQGAYSCEAINTHGSVFAQPDAILQVRGSNPSVCVPPQFNAAAYSAQDCLTCFCFGATDQCYSSDRFVTQVSYTPKYNLRVITEQNIREHLQRVFFYHKNMCIDFGDNL